MPPRMVVKRLRENRQARRTNEPLIHQPELPVFRNILNNYGRSALRCARRWEDFACRQASTRQQLFFLHECLRKDILPRSIRYRPPIDHPQAWTAARQFGRRMIRLMITDAHNRLRKYDRSMNEHRSSCLQVVGQQLTEQLEAAIEHRVANTRTKKHNALLDKLSKLTSPKDENISDGWIRNLSNRPISDAEKQVLIKGLNYNYRDATATDFLAAFESVLQSNGLDEETQKQIRHTIVPAITHNKQYNALTRQEKEAMNTLKSDETIIILPADKGRMSVIMNREDYIEKATRLLNDTTTYRCIDTDPTSQLTNKVNKTLKQLQELKQITKEERERMRARDSNIAQFYGLPKVHKDNAPLRPIVSLPGTPTYNLAKEMWRRLKHLTYGSQYSITNAQQFLQKIKDLRLDNDETMISFDVTALFTSVNLQTAIAVITERLKVSEQQIGKMTTENVCKLLHLCLSTHFSFNGKIYEQLKGAPMGSPVSGLIAEMAMQKLEEEVLPLINPKLWVRYVDDTFVIIRRNQITVAQQLLNNAMEGIQFTMELEKERQLPFLDVLVTRTMEGELQTSVYRKGTHTDQILNFNSNHPKCHKVSCVRTLFRRVQTHCSTTEAKQMEEKHLLKCFQLNGYPRSFIRRCLNHNNVNIQPTTTTTAAAATTNTTTTTTEKRVVLPYMKNISEMAARLLKQHHLIVAHKPTATLRKTLSKPKEKLRAHEQRNVVYKIPCRDCERDYVGQTGRKLVTRIQEHKRACVKHYASSLVSIHVDEEGHSFDWSKAEVLARGETRKEREFLEAWFSTKHSINMRVDIDSIYEPLRQKERKNLLSR
ncbi:unnamed protein product, partial [Dicrocoelium dendriticum]